MPRPLPDIKAASIAHLKAHGDMSARELAEAVGASQATAGKHLKAWRIANGIEVGRGKRPDLRVVGNGEGNGENAENGIEVADDDVDEVSVDRAYLLTLEALRDVVLDNQRLRRVVEQLTPAGEG